MKTYFVAVLSFALLAACSFETAVDGPVVGHLGTNPTPSTTTTSVKTKPPANEPVVECPSDPRPECELSTTHWCPDNFVAYDCYPDQGLPPEGCFFTDPFAMCCEPCEIHCQACQPTTAQCEKIEAPIIPCNDEEDQYVCDLTAGPPPASSCSAWISPGTFCCDECWSPTCNTKCDLPPGTPCPGGGICWSGQCF